MNGRPKQPIQQDSGNYEILESMLADLEMKEANAVGRGDRRFGELSARLQEVQEAKGKASIRIPKILLPARPLGSEQLRQQYAARVFQEAEKYGNALTKFEKYKSGKIDEETSMPDIPEMFFEGHEDLEGDAMVKRRRLIGAALNNLATAMNSKERAGIHDVVKRGTARVKAQNAREEIWRRFSTADAYMNFDAREQKITEAIRKAQKGLSEENPTSVFGRLLQFELECISADLLGAIYPYMQGLEKVDEEIASQPMVEKTRHQSEERQRRHQERLKERGEKGFNNELAQAILTVLAGEDVSDDEWLLISDHLMLTALKEGTLKEKLYFLIPDVQAIFEPEIYADEGKMGTLLEQRFGSKEAITKKFEANRQKLLSAIVKQYVRKFEAPEGERFVKKQAAECLLALIAHLQSVEKSGQKIALGGEFDLVQLTEVARRSINDVALSERQIGAIRERWNDLLARPESVQERGIAEFLNNYRDACETATTELAKVEALYQYRYALTLVVERKQALVERAREVLSRYCDNNERKAQAKNIILGLIKAIREEEQPSKKIILQEKLSYYLYLYQQMFHEAFSDESSDWLQRIYDRFSGGTSAQVIDGAKGVGQLDLIEQHTAAKTWSEVLCASFLDRLQEEAVYAKNQAAYAAAVSTVDQWEKLRDRLINKYLQAAYDACVQDMRYADAFIYRLNRVSKLRFWPQMPSQYLDLKKKAEKALRKQAEDIGIQLDPEGRELRTFESLQAALVQIDELQNKYEYQGADYHRYLDPELAAVASILSAEAFELKEAGISEGDLKEELEKKQRQAIRSMLERLSDSKGANSWMGNMVSELYQIHFYDDMDASGTRPSKKVFALEMREDVIERESNRFRKNLFEEQETATGQQLAHSYSEAGGAQPAVCQYFKDPFRAYIEFVLNFGREQDCEELGVRVLPITQAIPLEFEAESRAYLPKAKGLFNKLAKTVATNEQKRQLSASLIAINVGLAGLAEIPNFQAAMEKDLCQAIGQYGQLMSFSFESIQQYQETLCKEPEEIRDALSPYKKTIAKAIKTAEGKYKTALEKLAEQMVTQLRTKVVEWSQKENFDLSVPSIIQFVKANNPDEYGFLKTVNVAALFAEWLSLLGAERDRITYHELKARAERIRAVCLLLSREQMDEHFDKQLEEETGINQLFDILFLEEGAEEVNEADLMHIVDITELGEMGLFHRLAKAFCPPAYRIEKEEEAILRVTLTPEDFKELTTFYQRAGDEFIGSLSNVLRDDKPIAAHIAELATALTRLEREFPGDALQKVVNMQDLSVALQTFAKAFDGDEALDRVRFILERLQLVLFEVEYEGWSLYNVVARKQMDFMIRKAQQDGMSYQDWTEENKAFFGFIHLNMPDVERECQEWWLGEMTRAGSTDQNFDVVYSVVYQQLSGRGGLSHSVTLLSAWFNHYVGHADFSTKLEAMAVNNFAPSTFDAYLKESTRTFAELRELQEGEFLRVFENRGGVFSHIWVALAEFDRDLTVDATQLIAGLNRTLSGLNKDMQIAMREQVQRGLRKIVESRDEAIWPDSLYQVVLAFGDDALLLEALKSKVMETASPETLEKTVEQAAADILKKVDEEHRNAFYKQFAQWLYEQYGQQPEYQLPLIQILTQYDGRLCAELLLPMILSEQREQLSNATRVVFLRLAMQGHISPEQIEKVFQPASAVDYFSKSETAKELIRALEDTYVMSVKGKSDKVRIYSPGKQQIAEQLMTSSIHVGDEQTVGDVAQEAIYQNNRNWFADVSQDLSWLLGDELKNPVYQGLMKMVGQQDFSQGTLKSYFGNYSEEVIAVSNAILEQPYDSSQRATAIRLFAFQLSLEQPGERAEESYWSAVTKEANFYLEQVSMGLPENGKITKINHLDELIEKIHKAKEKLESERDNLTKGVLGFFRKIFSKDAISAVVSRIALHTQIEKSLTRVRGSAYEAAQDIDKVYARRGRTLVVSREILAVVQQLDQEKFEDAKQYILETLNPEAIQAPVIPPGEEVEMREVERKLPELSVSEKARFISGVLGKLTYLSEHAEDELEKRDLTDYPEIVELLSALGDADPEVTQEVENFDARLAHLQRLYDEAVENRRRNEIAKERIEHFCAVLSLPNARPKDISECVDALFEIDWNMFVAHIGEATRAALLQTIRDADEAIKENPIKKNALSRLEVLLQHRDVGTIPEVVSDLRELSSDLSVLALIQGALEGESGYALRAEKLGQVAYQIQQFDLLSKGSAERTAFWKNKMAEMLDRLLAENRHRSVELARWVLTSMQLSLGDSRLSRGDIEYADIIEERLEQDGKMMRLAEFVQNGDNPIPEEQFLEKRVEASEDLVAQVEMLANDRFALITQAVDAEPGEIGFRELPLLFQQAQIIMLYADVAEKKSLVEKAQKHIERTLMPDYLISQDKEYHAEQLEHEGVQAYAALLTVLLLGTKQEKQKLEQKIDAFKFFYLQRALTSELQGKEEHVRYHFLEDTIFRGERGVRFLLASEHRKTAEGRHDFSVRLAEGFTLEQEMAARELLARLSGDVRESERINEMRSKINEGSDVEKRAGLISAWIQAQGKAVTVHDLQDIAMWIGAASEMVGFDDERGMVVSAINTLLFHVRAIHNDTRKFELLSLFEKCEPFFLKAWSEEKQTEGQKLFEQVKKLNESVAVYRLLSNPSEFREIAVAELPEIDVDRKEVLKFLEGPATMCADKLPTPPERGKGKSLQSYGEKMDALEEKYPVEKLQLLEQLVPDNQRVAMLKKAVVGYDVELFFERWKNTIVTEPSKSEWHEAVRKRHYVLADVVAMIIDNQLDISQYVIMSGLTRRDSFDAKKKAFAENLLDKAKMLFGVVDKERNITARDSQVDSAERQYDLKQLLMMRDVLVLLYKQREKLNANTQKIVEYAVKYFVQGFNRILQAHGNIPEREQESQEWLDGMRKAQFVFAVQKLDELQEEGATLASIGLDDLRDLNKFRKALVAVGVQQENPKYQSDDPRLGLIIGNEERNYTALWDKMPCEMALVSLCHDEPLCLEGREALKIDNERIRSEESGHKFYKHFSEDEQKKIMDLGGAYQNLRAERLLSFDDKSGSLSRVSFLWVKLFMMGLLFNKEGESLYQLSDKDFQAADRYGKVQKFTRELEAYFNHFESKLEALQEGQEYEYEKVIVQRKKVIDEIEGIKRQFMLENQEPSHYGQYVLEKINGVLEELKRNEEIARDLGHLVL